MQKEIIMSVYDETNNFILCLKAVSLPFPTQCVSIDWISQWPGFLWPRISIYLTGYLYWVFYLARIFIWDLNIKHTMRTRPAELSLLKGTNNAIYNRLETEIFQDLIFFNEKNKLQHLEKLLYSDIWLIKESHSHTG